MDGMGWIFGRRITDLFDSIVDDDDGDVPNRSCCRMTGTFVRLID